MKQDCKQNPKRGMLVRTTPLLQKNNEGPSAEQSELKPKVDLPKTECHDKIEKSSSMKFDSNRLTGASKKNDFSVFILSGLFLQKA